jgi:PAS domain S-box-containing protein
MSNAALRNDNEALRNDNEALRNENAALSHDNAVLSESDLNFRALFEKGPIGVAYHRMVYDDSGKPVDYHFLAANKAYQQLTGVDPVGKTVTQAFPGIENDPFDWIGKYGEVARTGTEFRIQQYLPQNDRWYDCVAYQYKPDHFVAAFLEISERKKAQESLRKSEENLRITLDSIGDAVIATDADGCVSRMNPVAEKLTGWSNSQALKIPLKEVFRIINAQTRQEVDNPVAQVMKSGTIVGLANHTVLISRDGTEYQIADSAAPIIAVDGEICGVVLVFRDVTEEYAVRREMETTNALLRAVIEQSPVPMALFTAPDNKLKLFNRDSLDFFDIELLSSGNDTAEILNKLDLSTFEGETVPPEETAIFRALQGESTHKREIRLADHDGNYHFHYSEGVPVFDNSGNLIAGFVIFPEITDLKLAQEALLESEARFKALHNASFGGIAIHNQGIILDCNQGLSEMSGYSESELIGMDGLQLIAEESRRLVLKNIKDGYEKPYEAMGLRKNGEKYPLRLEGRNVPYKGKTVRTVEFRDMTEQKLAEQAQQKMQDQLNQAHKMESIGRLAGGVAHDFNNMLSVILGYAEIALEQAESDEILHSGLLEIQNAAQRSAEITQQLLAFARKQTIAPDVLDLNQTVEGMLKMLGRLIGENIDLAWLPGKDIWPVMMDPSQLNQLLTNLCINGRDAISDVGRITIETSTVTFDESYCENNREFIPGDYVMLAVSDDGCGIESETIKNLFEPFFTTKGVRGTGLGLATVYGIVKQNKGFVNVYSEPGKGTTFKIYLARHRAAAEHIGRSDTALANLSGNETILLVEDEPSILKMAAYVIEKSGYTVLKADRPGEAIRIATEYPGDIHLLVTDVVMPEMNGRSLAKNLLSLYPNMKCLFMSGYTANVIAHHGVLDKGVHFLQKPFSRKDLTTKLRDVLDDN